MRVLVTGAAGYLGGAVVPALQAEGHEVRALVHHPSPVPQHLHGIDTAPGDVVIDLGLAAACAGCDAVVHLVGIIRESHGRTMERVHVRGTERILAAARLAGVRRMIYVSAVGARAHGQTPYQRTKAQAEQAVAASGIAHTIIRPTVIFGPGGPAKNLVTELGGILKAAPFALVVGDGRYLMQPVSARNVAQGCARALALPAAEGRIYEVGGPERLTYVEVLRRIAAAMGRPFRPLHVPVGLLRPLLPALERLPGFPLTADALTMLLEGSVCDAAPFFRAFGLTPDRFEGR